MNKEAKATLNIEITVKCPHCNHYFDLIENTNLNDDGWLLNEVIGQEDWSEVHKTFHEEAVECPECGDWFDVKGIEW